MPANTIATIEQALRRADLVGARLIVAVSGGADSVALLLGLVELRTSLDLDLVVAHVDHQLRAESAADAARVRGLAESLGLPVRVETVEVAAEARRGKTGVEEAARVARYRFFGRLCRDVDARAVVVGHTADDQTETRLLHLTRGTGLGGLVGMPEDGTVRIPDEPPVRVVRPLLSLPHAATEAYCRERDVTWSDDPSNRDRTFARNRLRHAVVPELRAINPGLDRALERVARTAADAQDFVEAELDRRLGNLVVTASDHWLVDRDAWRQLPAALQRALLLRAACALGANASGDLGADQVEAARQAALSWRAGRMLEWPGGLRVRIERDTFVIERALVGTAPTAGTASDERGGTPGSADIRSALPGGQVASRAELRDTMAIPLDVAGTYSIGPIAPSLVGRGLAGSQARPLGRLEVRRLDAPCRDRGGDPWHADLDRVKLAGDVLLVRSRRAGDRIAPVGMTGRKKLQDLLVDGHVPRGERDQVPVVAMGPDVAWVAGMGRDRRFAADEECRDVVCLAVVVAAEEPMGELAGE